MRRNHRIHREREGSPPAVGALFKRAPTHLLVHREQAGSPTESIRGKKRVGALSKRAYPYRFASVLATEQRTAYLSQKHPSRRF